MSDVLLIDDAGPDWTLARVSWRDAADEPWKSVTDYALKTAGELRRVIAGAIASGSTKHKFYRLDHGKSRTSSETMPIDANEGENTMNKATKKVTTKKRISKAPAVSVDPELKKAIAAAKKRGATKASKKEAPLGDAKGIDVVQSGKVTQHVDAPKAEKSKESEKSQKKWFTIKVDGDNRQLTDGPYPQKREALELVGNKSGDYSSKIAKGCYRRTDKQPDGSKISFLVMTDWYAKANGYKLPHYAIPAK